MVFGLHVAHHRRVSDVTESLRLLLTRARWRLRTAAPGSPEWDAASTAVEELEGRLAVAKRPRRPAPIPTVDR
jgi:hypothetical protein